MDRPLILYLHGFCSSPASLKSRQLGEYMSERGLGDRFVCPPLSPVPDAAVATASRLIAGANVPVTLVGSSLGGHYANYLAEKHGLLRLWRAAPDFDDVDAVLRRGLTTEAESGEAP